MRKDSHSAFPLCRSRRRRFFPRQARPDGGRSTRRRRSAPEARMSCTTCRTIRNRTRARRSRREQRSQGRCRWRSNLDIRRARRSSPPSRRRWRCVQKPHRTSRGTRPRRNRPSAPPPCSRRCCSCGSWAHAISTSRNRRSLRAAALAAPSSSDETPSRCDAQRSSRRGDCTSCRTFPPSRS